MRIFVILVVARFVFATDGVDGGDGDGFQDVNGNGNGFEEGNGDGFQDGNGNGNGFEEGNGGGFDNNVVETPVGCVKCTTEVLPGGGIRYRKCIGIKYAEAERFGDPRSIPSSSCPGIPINGDDCPICMQASNSDNSVISEDCLFLNVFVPLDCGEDPLPVVFYIHGGSFESGNGPKVPSNLLGKCVIVVTINYRLSVFGFLSTGTCDCPGNSGLKDCLIALQWVNANIAYFGGNPNEVTLYGLSAGAAIVSYLQINPLACGLYNKIIMESGALNAPWAFTTPSKAIENAKKIGELVGCKDSPTLCSCLKSVPANLLAAKTKEVISITDMMTFAVVPFSPTVENRNCPNTFMTENPQDLILKGAVCVVKIMIGVAQEESCAMQKTIQQYKQFLIPLTALAYKIAPQCLSETTNLQCISYLTKEIIAHYAKYDLVFNEKNILKPISIVQFILPIMVYANLMEKFGCKIYLYEFAYLGRCSVSRFLNPEGKLTCHAEMFPYLFQYPPSQQCSISQTDKTAVQHDIAISGTMTSLYARFVTSGCPTPNEATGGLIWPTWTSKQQAYLEINVPEPRIMYGLQNSEILFWKNLQEKCFSDIVNIILNPGGKNCCSTCPKGLSPCALN